VLAAMLAVACNDKPAETKADAAVSTPPVASSVAPASSAPTPAASASGAHHDGERRGGGHGGPGAMLFKAARTLDLKPEQKAKVDAAEKSAHATAGDAGAAGDAGDGSRDAMQEAAKGLHTELIAEVKAGKIDNAKLEPHYAAVEKVTAGMQQKEADALTALHAALDPTQRKAVTAAVRAKAEEWEDKREDMEERKAEHVGNVVDAGGSDAGFALGGTKRSLDRLTRGLELDAEQQKKLDAIATKEDANKANRPDPDEMKKRMESLLVAFEKDAFDAKKLELFDAKKARGPMERETKLLVQLLPILKPEQREKLAAKMEKGPSPHGRRGGPGHRGLGGGD
jgi:Spy/CpxP family protein refolding chaperone